MLPGLYRGRVQSVVRQPLVRRWLRGHDVSGCARNDIVAGGANHTVVDAEDDDHHNHDHADADYDHDHVPNHNHDHDDDDDLEARNHHWWWSNSWRSLPFCGRDLHLRARGRHLELVHEGDLRADVSPHMQPAVQRLFHADVRVLDQGNAALP